MPLEELDAAETIILDEKQPAQPPAVKSPPPVDTLDRTVVLVPGMLSFHDGKTRHSCAFQFNPTELERSRTIKITRSPTGNTREEPTEGPRNQAKRKFTGKPEPWAISLSLRYDASYHQNPKVGAGSYKHRIERIDEALSFFESLGEPGPFVSENAKQGNADETPQTPKVDLTYGQRQWRCTVTSIRIKELEYTPDLYPRRFEVTLALEAIETVRNGIDRKPGAKR